MLEVNDIQAFYGASQALFGTCFKVKSGQVVTLMGRNGMGWGCCLFEKAR